MTHSTVSTDEQNSGSYRVVYRTINITSLDNAGAETFDPEAESGLTDALGVSVAGQEADATFVSYDHVAGTLTATNIADGTDVAAGTDVGEVTLRIDGSAGP